MTIQKYQDNEKEEDDRKVIACEYMTGWFWIDFVSIIPFNIIMTLIMGSEGGNMDAVAKLNKMARISKLIRIMRIVKLIKVFKHKDKISQIARKHLKINKATERLAIISLVFIGSSHLFACGWILIGDGELSPDSWLFG